MACEDCLEVCFVGLVVERICVWCLVIVFIFMDLDKQEKKRCGGCLKVIRGSFDRKGRFSVCNTAVL